MREERRKGIKVHKKRHEAIKANSMRLVRKDGEGEDERAWTEKLRDVNGRLSMVESEGGKERWKELRIKKFVTGRLCTTYTEREREGGGGQKKVNQNKEN